VSRNIYQIAKEILALADIRVNGKNPWDIQVHNNDFLLRALTEGELGVGESYMAGWWDAERIDETIFKIMSACLDEKIRKKLAITMKILAFKLFNFQSKGRAFIVGEKHYNLGNDLFLNMLDTRMNYSCGYWKDAAGLDAAQEDKLGLICRKLYLKPGMRILDIGCGWGAFGKYAAEKYGVEVVGITVSKEQVEMGNRLCAGLPVEFQLIDYRDVKGSFDRIVSVGMIEHVGVKNYRSFFEVARNCLKDSGLFLLHTIGNNNSAHATDLWTHKYIFPNGMLPSIAQLGKAIENLFVMEDWHNFGPDYDLTLMAWYRNFEKNWHEIRDQYTDTFYRMWKYYLLSCAGAFRSRRIQLWQIVLSKNGILNGYQSVR
jgi:cyclopropane-fatty-acyl-phospholipid synthase